MRQSVSQAAGWPLGGSADDAVAEGPGQTGARADARTEPGFRAADIQTFDLMRPESESEGEGAAAGGPGD